MVILGTCSVKPPLKLEETPFFRHTFPYSKFSAQYELISAFPKDFVTLSSEYPARGLLKSLKSIKKELMGTTLKLRWQRMRKIVLKLPGDSWE